MNHKIKVPEYSFFETPIEAKGHQYLGYLDISSLVISSCGHYATLGLVDINNQYLTFTISAELFIKIKQQLSLIQFESTKHLFIWLEANVNGTVINQRTFQVQWALETLSAIYQKVYHFESLYQLIVLVENCKTLAIKQFGLEILADIELIQNWVSLPASRNHHHAYPGGLLEHSLECAMLAKSSASMLTEMSVREREVTIFAALLHDLGKTKTLSINGHTSLGLLINHELLNLQILAKPLKKLSRTWQEGAECLQYLLTWKAKMGFCKFIGGNIIQLADHISTSASIRRKAFDGKPDYYNFSSIVVSGGKQFINRI